MSKHQDLSDDYVASLLKADAKKRSDQYALVGLSALLPSRPTTHAPKPNVRFLRNILRETDTHNTALLAKEAEEAKERYHNLYTPVARPSSRHSRSERHGKRGLPLDDEEQRASKRRRSHSREWGRDRESHQRTRGRDERSTSRHKTSTRSHHDVEKNRKRRFVHSDGSESDPKSAKHGRRSSHSTHEHRESQRASSHRHDGHRRRRSRSPQSSRRSHAHHKSRRRRDRSLSSDSISTNDHRRRGRGSPDTTRTRAGHRRSPSPSRGVDSDPLEDLVGPLPPKAGPPVRRRGRGAFSAAEHRSGVDARFAPDYDPAIDVQPLSDDGGGDDWEQALEVMRDRQRWKQQGADRLRQAGFTEEQVKKWEKGDERTEEDVRWAKKGEGREWDRGKVLDDTGHIIVQPEWGRPKNT